MNICFLTNDLNTGAGWGRMATDLISSVKNKNIDVSVISYENGLLKEPILNFFKIRNIFKTCDVIHALDVWPFGFVAALYSIGLNKKILITAVGTYSVAPFYKFITKIPSVFACRRASQITAISRYTAQEINKVLPHLKIEIINNGVDFDKWSRQIPLFDTSGLEPYIIGVGGIKQRKGFHSSILAFAQIAKDFPKLNYVIVGQLDDKFYVNKLKKIAIENGINNRVIFLGRVDDNKLLSLYRNAEIFILTPEEYNHHFEGFGLVYLEAAANGIPSIGSQQSGAEDAIKEGISGFLVKQGEVSDIAQALRKILGNTDLKNKLSAGAIDWVKENTWQKAGVKYIELYKKLFNE